jgi:hypothetical protein
MASSWLIHSESIETHTNHEEMIEHHFHMSLQGVGVDNPTPFFYQISGFS